MITELIYEAGLVLTGYVLAYKTHSIEKKFRKSKELIFFMYNISLSGIVFVLVLFMAYIEHDESYMIQGMGVLWGTTISIIVNLLILSCFKNPKKTSSHMK